MSRVRRRDTHLELLVHAELRRLGLRFRRHAALPGRPDIVFPGRRLAIFLDGDFWHGYRFPLWALTVSPFWQEKIAKNRRRDLRNFARLRRRGWQVMRVWGHAVKNDLDGVVARIQSRLDAAGTRRDSRSKTTAENQRTVRRHEPG